MQHDLPEGEEGKKDGRKSAYKAGLYALVLGPLGVHDFYLGYKKKGVLKLAISAAGYVASYFTGGITAALPVFMGFWSIFEGARILTGHKTTDAAGNPLRYH